MSPQVPDEASATAERSSRLPAAGGSAGTATVQPAGFAANLPKGGGAIRGIDERVHADAFRGTARLSVPLPVNRIRNGVSPELSLDYESGQGNGAFGVGWGVGVPSIFRRSDKGIPRY